MLAMLCLSFAHIKRSIGTTQDEINREMRMPPKK